MDAAAPALSAGLYRRLGGAAGMSAIVDGMVDRHAANPLLAPRFRDGDLPQLKAQSVAFFTSCLGAASDADSDSQRLAHAGMQFDAAELAAVIEDVALTLEENGLDAADVAAFTALLSPPPPSHPLSEENTRNHELYGHELQTGGVNEVPALPPRR